MSDEARRAILEHVREACESGLEFSDAEWCYLERHGLELYDGEDDMVLFAVYEDYTTKGKLCTAGELVIPGRKTIRECPACGAHGIHFRKTYDPSAPPMRRGETPEREYARTTEILERLPADQRALIAPLGYSQTEYRARFIPGRTFDTVSPFSLLSYDEALAVPLHERDLDEHAIRVEKLYGVTNEMHRRGLAHGDLHLANVMVLPDGHVQLIDFAGSADLGSEDHEALVEDDLSEILREAALVQASLGRRLNGEVFEKSLAEADDLFPEEIAHRLKALRFLVPSASEVADLSRKLEARNQHPRVDGNGRR